MKYNYDEKTNQMLEELEHSILEEYDSTPDISVRVALLPQYHSAYSKYRKVVDENGSVNTTINAHRTDTPVTTVAIHEATPGKPDGSMPTKPPRFKTNIAHYEKILRDGTPSDPRLYGSTIGYHSMIAYPGIMGNPEIVIYLPATCSPEQIANSALTKYTYGIERLCGEEQNYHMAIANQAMLAAFVLREIGYDRNSAPNHVFPHQFLAKNNKACPARTLYATELLEKKKAGQRLSLEDEEAIKEYVPWDVFSNLVEVFFERNRFPQELEEKFIMDKSDYEAYMQDPEGYNYSERKKFKQKTEIDPVRLTGPRELDVSYLRPVKTEELQNLTFTRKDKNDDNDKDEDLDR